MMKKLIYLGCMLGALVSISSCKKGEEDPFMSMKSRKARLSGEWVISEQSTTETYKRFEDGQLDQSSVVTLTYNGSTMNEKSSVYYAILDETFNSEEIYKYELSYQFEKDNSYTKTEKTYNEEGKLVRSTTISGSWQFGGKNKATELKNKETVVLKEQSVTETNYFGNDPVVDSYTIDQNSSGEVVYLQRLAKDEMTWEFKSETLEDFDGNRSEISLIGTLSFTKK